MTTTNDRAGALSDATVVLTARLRKPGVVRKVESGEIRVRAQGVSDLDAHDPDEASLRINKVLIDSPEYSEIRALDGAIRGYLRSQALPTRLAGGRYLIPVKLVEKVDARLAAFGQQRQELVATFCDAYPRLVEEARARLGDLFSERDYESAEAVRAAFLMETSIAALEIPGDGLARISQALYERELRKAQASREQMVGEIRDGLRYAMADLVNALVERLTPGEQGERKRIMASHVERLREFVDAFGARNVAGDQDLEALVAKARGLVAGVDVKELRRDTSVRDSLSGGLEVVKRALDGMISSNGSTLRASALELNDMPESPRLPETQSAARFAAIELTDPIPQAVRLNDVGADATAARSAVLELDERPATAPIPEITATARAAALELDA